jgi:hypothetical protein
MSLCHHEQNFQLKNFKKFSFNMFWNDFCYFDKV